MSRSTVSLLLALGLGALATGRAQDSGFPCEGVLAAPERLSAVLSRVPMYGSTYVLAYPESLADQVDSVHAPALERLRVAVYAGSPATTLAEQARLVDVQAYPSEAGQMTRIVEDLLTGELDVGILWAPLAGLGALELDFNYELSFLTTGEPAPPPALGQAAGAAAASTEACAEEIRGLLEGYGVVPAEKFVPLDIRDFLQIEAPPRDPAEARQGAELYARNCARCHGPEAVAAPDELAPVDLLISVPRFSFPGFLYIALNGRTQKGMPRFLGTLTQEQLGLIYQYVRERSHGRIAAEGPTSPAAEGS